MFQWRDPRLRALNPTLALPNAPIAIVARTTDSAATLVFTQVRPSSACPHPTLSSRSSCRSAPQALSKFSAQWRARVGAGTTVQWPTAVVAARSTDENLVLFATHDNAIGFVWANQAEASGLHAALMVNRAGTVSKSFLLAQICG